MNLTGFYLIGFVLILTATLTYIFVGPVAATGVFIFYFLLISFFIYCMCMIAIHFNNHFAAAFTTSIFLGTLIFTILPIPIYSFYADNSISFGDQLATYFYLTAPIGSVLFIIGNILSYWYTNHLSFAKSCTFIYFIACILIGFIELTIIIYLLPESFTINPQLISSLCLFVLLCIGANWILSLAYTRKNLYTLEYLTLYKKIIHLKHIIPLCLLGFLMGNQFIQFLSLISLLTLLYLLFYIFYEESFSKIINKVYSSSQILTFYPDAFMIVSNSVVVHHNKHAEKLFCVKEPETLLNRSFNDFVDSNALYNINPLINTLHTIPSESITSQFQMLTDEGLAIDVEAILTHCDFYEDAFLISIRDISERRKSAEMSHQFEVEKAKVEFFSSLSHELKTPINIIYSAAQLQNQLLLKHPDPKLLKYTEMISVNCLKLLKLINNLLDLNRIESDYFKVKYQYINIVEVTEFIFDSGISYAEQKNITSVFDTDVEQCYTYIDPELYERILLNLLSNAVKYTPEGGNIWCNITLDEDTVAITVKDSGVGIPPENLEAIFKRFVRIEDGFVRQSDGAGIGLSLAQSFTEMNKGQISVSSTVGIGTSFTVHFPIHHTDTYLESLYTPLKNKDKVAIEFSDFHT